MKTDRHERVIAAARGHLISARALLAVRQHRMPVAGPDVQKKWIDDNVALTISAVALQALALELALKARIAKSGKTIPREHDHTKLFKLIPAPERISAEAYYGKNRHPAFRENLVDALEFSKDAFIQWRYPHEHGTLTSAGGELLLAFKAIADGL